MMPREFLKNNKNILILILLYIGYSLAFIYLYSFVVGGVRYFTLFDDAMISMRYAKNFANGYGLTWNIGEAPIEGYSNLLWVMIMSLIHLIGASASKISLIIQLFAVVLSAFNIYFVYRISLIFYPRNSAVALGAAGLTAFYFPFNFWSLMGMEVSILSLLITYSVFLTLKNVKAGKFSYWQMILPAGAYLIRMDASLLFFVLLIFNYISYKNHRKKILLSGLAFFLVFVIALTLFRYIYYGEFLPNTYYLKMTGYPLILRLGRGIWITAKYLAVILILLYFAVKYIKENPNSFVFLLASLFGIQLAYSLWVGGDSWEWWGGANRFLSITIPLFFLLIAFSLSDLNVRICNRYSRLAGKENLVYFILILMSLTYLNTNRGSTSFKEWILVKTDFAKVDNINSVRVAVSLEPFVRQDTKVLVATAGVIPYFLDCNIIDLLGKNDVVISKIPMRISEGSSKYYDFNPGHLKWDYSYSIGVLKPDVIVEQWKNYEEAEAFLKNYYKKILINDLVFWVRLNSSKVDKKIFEYKI